MVSLFRNKVVFLGSMQHVAIQEGDSGGLKTKATQAKLRSQGYVSPSTH